MVTVRKSPAWAAVAALVMGFGTGASPAQAESEIPIEGQITVMGTRDSGTPLVVTVHGVRRTDGASFLYYSVGFPAGAELTDTPWLEMHASLGGALPVNQPEQLYRPMCDVAVIDNAGARMYAAVDGATCTTDEPGATEVGTALVYAVGLPALPTSVETVDVSIRGNLIADVPVQDGALTPQATDDRPTVLGIAWPRVAPDALGAEPEKSIYPLFQRVSDLEGTVTTMATAVDLNSDVLFAYDSAEVTAAGQQAVASAATYLAENDAQGTVTVTGHTDSDGSDAHNLDLSQRRAEAVAAVLRPLLPAGATVATEGQGEANPIADNATEQGKALNRRVTLTFTPGPAS